MTEQEVRQLLAVIITFDGRHITDFEVAAWKKMAELGNWTYSEAINAVTQHFLNRTEWLKPAHIQESVREQRRIASGHRRLDPGMY